MILLIDTNVLLDFLQKRRDFYPPAKQILKLCAQERVKGYVAFHSISNIWYIMRDFDDKTKRESLKDLCGILNICSVSHESVVSALDNTEFKDFEDCLQDKCAVAVGADYIITRNTADFAYASTKALEPTDFLSLWNYGE